ncbi:MAG TPA: GNAT family N-acetyltransferase [Candidatus Binataceae bacterium]|nr:GNAT family N-acetyltransferase [Candidatus Binataceae bacterium]
MGEITLRAVRNDDWSALLELAHLSLSELPIVPSQQEWMDNRRSFSPSDGIQHHFVATSGERIVGYAGLERRNTAPEGWYRLFVVVAPSARATLGTMLLAKLRERLISLDARHAWVMELAADAGFLSYLGQVGFVRSNTINLEDGIPAVQLTMDAPFQSLVQPA